MFENAGPRDKSKLTNGTCQNPWDKQGDSKKELANTKVRATAALESKLEAPYYYVSKKFYVDNEKKVLHKLACDVIISCTFKCKEIDLCVKEFNMLNAIVIPILQDPAGWTPADHWNFIVRRNLLEEYGFITLEEVLQWTEDEPQGNI